MSETRATLSLTPALSKRVIARAVAALPEVRRAFSHGRVLISAGSTTAHVYLALTGGWSDEPLACGMISSKGTCIGRDMNTFLSQKGHARFWFFEKGQRINSDDLGAVLESLDDGDVFIKGANALDQQGRVGVLLGVESGGILGHSYGYLMSRGVNLVLPVGLEKMVLGSIDRTAREMGTRKVDLTMGMPVGLMPINGKRICEIEALSLLAGVEVFHAASGGLAGAEGSVLLLIKGSQPQVESAIKLFRELKGDKRYDALTVAPSLCAEHKWPACAQRNFLYSENVKQGI